MANNLVKGIKWGLWSLYGAAIGISTSLASFLSFLGIKVLTHQTDSLPEVVVELNAQNFSYTQLLKCITMHQTCNLPVEIVVKRLKEDVVVPGVATLGTGLAVGFVAGGCYFLYQNWQTNRPGYTQIRDNDLEDLASVTARPQHY